MKNPFDVKDIDNFNNPLPSEDNSEPLMPQFNVNSGAPSMNFEAPIPEVQTMPAAPAPEKRKFNIADLYWLRNLKPNYNQAMLPNETMALVISYNADFENLRISFVNPPDKDLNKTISIPGGARQNSVNIFSEVCREIISVFEMMNDKTQYPIIVNNCERVIGLGNNQWTPNETQFKIVAPQVMEIHTKQPNGTQQSFTMVLWQVKAFLECCRFMTNGNSWMLKMHTVIHKE